MTRTKLIGDQPGSDPIDFFLESDPFFELSSYFPCAFEGYGLRWPSAEHFFQAQKFTGPELATYRERIRTAPTPREAKALGQTRVHPLRDDWERVKEGVMLSALRRKFEDPELRALLLSTGSRPLREASPEDSYWGTGPDGEGLNRLGTLLALVRDELRSPPNH